MVKHIILWTLKETDADKKAEILANMKEHLEGLAGKVPGLLEVYVRTNPLAFFRLFLKCIFECRGYA